MLPLARAYHGWIEWLVDMSQVTDKTWHIHAGLAILLLARLLLRAPLRSFVPLGVVILAELGNEILDRIYVGQWLWEETTYDALYTLFWPTVLSCGALASARYPLLNRPPRWLRRWIDRSANSARGED